MAYMTFTDALTQAKRASQLRGVPFSTRDVMNLQSGYMEGAAERTAGERASVLAEKSQTATEKNWADTLAQEKDLATRAREQNQFLTQAQIEAQDKASTKALTGNVISTGATLGGAYLMMPKTTGLGLTAAQASLQGGEATPILQSMAGGAEGVAPVVAGEGGFTAGSATGLGVIGAGVAGGLLTKDIAKDYTDEGGVLGYAAESAQHPVAAVVDPLTTASDLGILGSSSPIARGEEWVVNKIFGGCIIVTACTDRNSTEVEIAREYRDKFLDAESLRGYYFIAEKISPILEHNKTIRRIVKRYLVDRLIDYGKVALGKRTQTVLAGSQVVSGLFLMLCRMIGKMKKQYVRANGEVY